MSTQMTKKSVANSRKSLYDDNQKRKSLKNFLKETGRRIEPTNEEID